MVVTERRAWVTLQLESQVRADGLYFQDPSNYGDLEIVAATGQPITYAAAEEATFAAGPTPTILPPFAPLVCTIASITNEGGGNYLVTFSELVEPINIGSTETSIQLYSPTMGWASPYLESSSTGTAIQFARPDGAADCDTLIITTQLATCIVYSGDLFQLYPLLTTMFGA